MYTANQLLMLYVESPLHTGSGRGAGVVDLPIQRERMTGYPMVQGSGIKGCLRANARGKTSNGDLELLFGPETEKASEHAGALAVGDARLLLFPVRSLAGVFAYTTSVDALERFRRAAQALGLSFDWKLPASGPDENKAWVNGNALQVDEVVVLEEFAFEVDESQKEQLGKLGQWLQKALPTLGEYWKNALSSHLCVLPDDAFRDFTQFATEVQTHIKLNPDTKTVEKGALFTSEALPTDSILYAPLMASAARKKDVKKSAEDMLKMYGDLNIGRVQLGGDETTGQGWVTLASVPAPKKEEKRP